MDSEKTIGFTKSEEEAKKRACPWNNMAFCMGHECMAFARNYGDYFCTRAQEAFKNNDND